MSDFNDQQTMNRLMSMTTEQWQSDLRVYRAFCQWCTSERFPVKRELLLCSTCDESAARA